MLAIGCRLCAADLSRPLPGEFKCHQSNTAAHWLPQQAPSHQYCWLRVPLLISTGSEHPPCTPVPSIYTAYQTLSKQPLFLCLTKPPLGTRKRTASCCSTELLQVLWPPQRCFPSAASCWCRLLLQAASITAVTGVFIAKALQVANSRCLYCGRGLFLTLRQIRRLPGGRLWQRLIGGLLGV